MTVPRLRSVVLDTTDARRLADFYRQLTGYDYRPGDEVDAGQDWLMLLLPDGRTHLAFQQVDALPRPTWPDPGVAQQLHLDFVVDTRAELAEMHERAVSLGATLLEDGTDDPDEPIYIYADPDGHPFCIFVHA
jgi:catechol-2,3-dioxygenase